MGEQVKEVGLSDLVQPDKKENITGVKILLALLGLSSVLGILFALGTSTNPNYADIEDDTIITMIAAFAPIVSLLVCFHLMSERKPRAMRMIAKTKIITWLITVVAAFIFIGGQVSATVLVVGAFSTTFWVVIVSLYAVCSKSYRELYKEENV